MQRHLMLAVCGLAWAVVAVARDHPATSPIMPNAGRAALREAKIKAMRERMMNQNDKEMAGSPASEMDHLFSAMSMDAAAAAGSSKPTPAEQQLVDGILADPDTADPKPSMDDVAVNSTAVRGAVQDIFKLDGAEGSAFVHGMLAKAADPRDADNADETAGISLHSEPGFWSAKNPLWKTKQPMILHSSEASVAQARDIKTDSPVMPGIVTPNRPKE
jgi:hypothetical protein